MQEYWIIPIEIRTAGSTKLIARKVRHAVCQSRRLYGQVYGQVHASARVGNDSKTSQPGIACGMHKRRNSFCIQCAFHFLFAFELGIVSPIQFIGTMCTTCLLASFKVVLTRRVKSLSSTPFIVSITAADFLPSNRFEIPRCNAS